MGPERGSVTELLERWRDGDEAALENLVPQIRRELHRIARRHLMREQHASLEASSLVQEAFVRLLPDPKIDWRNRAHFFAVSSQVMRHVLVDHARARQSEKRGAGALHLELNEAIAVSPGRIENILAIDQALDRLAQADSRKAKVAEMRLFGGLGTEEIAEALSVAPKTVLRDWNFARAWLRRQLTA
jgi:RNA polymerase sigma factor (TIGR02999 family)